MRRQFLIATMTMNLAVGCVPAVVVNIDPRLSLRDNDHQLGAPDASVVVIEYGDLECPICGRFAREVFPAIQTQYIDNNRVLWVFRHLPLPELHAHALTAATASECAAQQDGFYEYIELLFNNQSAFEDVDLIGYATDLGLDQDMFMECSNSDRHDERVNSDREDAIALGASGTPTFFINGRIARGFFDVADFSALLNSALEQAGP